MTEAAIGVLLLARHGESTWNVARRWQGHGDPPLSARGCAQADQLALALAAHALDFVVTSDLVRARDTAARVAAAAAVELIVDPAWREIDVGAWTGRTRAEVRSHWPDVYRRVRDGATDEPLGGGESRTAFARRVHAATAALRIRAAGRRVLVVTHRGVLRVLVPDAQPVHATAITLPVTDAAPHAW